MDRHYFVVGANKSATLKKKQFYKYTTNPHKLIRNSRLQNQKKIYARKYNKQNWTNMKQ